MQQITKHFFSMTICFRIKIIALVLITILGLSCSNSEDDKKEPSLTIPTTNLTGTWDMQVVHYSDDCIGYPKTKEFSIRAIHSGNGFTIESEDLNWDFKGTISGNKISAMYTLYDSYKKTTSSIDGTVLNNNVVTCKAEWTKNYTDTSESCTGSSEITATRLIDVTGSWDGAWRSNEYDNIQGITLIEIEQNKADLTGTITVYYDNYTRTDAYPLKGSVSVSDDYVIFGDIGDEYITYNGSFYGNDQMSGIYEMQNPFDKGIWKAKRKSEKNISHRSKLNFKDTQTKEVMPQLNQNPDCKYRQISGFGKQEYNLIEDKVLSKRNLFDTFVLSKPLHTLKYKPFLDIVSIPAHGNRLKNLSGKVYNVDSSQSHIAVFILVTDVWKVKPFSERPFTNIDRNDYWSCDITTAYNDHLATKIAIFLLPVDFEITHTKNGNNLPEELYQNAICKKEFSRPPSDKK